MVFYILCLEAEFLVFIVWFMRDTLTTRKAITLLTVLSFTIRCMYAAYTGWDVRQHDIGAAGAGYGHIGYIEYLLENGHLPDFDPRSVLQFYHPPLHYIVAAGWLKLNLVLGVGYEAALENIQFLTVMYTMVINLASLSIFRSFSLKGPGLSRAYAIVAIHPTLIIMSGSINNDIMCVMFMMLSVMYALRWYKSQRIAEIAKTGVTLAFAVVTKTSGILVSPALAVLFLYVFVKRPEMRVRLIGQYAVFAVCAIPLAMSWTLYNFFKYGMPIGYVLPLGDDSWQYIGDHSAISRILDKEIIFPQSCFVKWQDGTEYNMFSALLKTSVFGEFTLAGTAFGKVLCYVLYYVNMAVIAVSGWGFVSMIRKERNIKVWFVAALYATLLASYINFCFGFPHTCTMNIRYIVPTIPLGALGFGHLYNQKHPLLKLSGNMGPIEAMMHVLKNGPDAKRLRRMRYWRDAITTLTAAFCVCGLLVYLFLGIGIL